MLEVAVGTGANLPFLSRSVTLEGAIVAIDLSVSMMRIAQLRAKSLPTPIHFVRADACYLPFADNTFDAVFHFGGLNMFGDVGTALREMVRVAKPGASIVVSDEGMSEARRRTWLGRQLGRMNSLNLCRPPSLRFPGIASKISSCIGHGASFSTCCGFARQRSVVGRPMQTKVHRTPLRRK